MHHVVFLSGGISSYMTANRVINSIINKGERLSIVFTDTLIEDDDLYRFLIEISCSLLNRVVDDEVKEILSRVTTIPSIQNPMERGKYLLNLGYEATKVIKGLYWIADGRNPWEVMKDNRVIGNALYSICSKKLKQEMARKWLERYCRIRDTIIYIGITADEKERYEGNKTKLGARRRWLPWICKAPLLDPPVEGFSKAKEILAKLGIKIPKLYEEGFPHNNCGGFCVRAGHSSFRLLFEKRYDTYIYHENKEQEMIKFLDRDVAILRIRKLGKTIPLPMLQLRKEIEEKSSVVDGLDFRGCGCFTDGDDE